MDEQSAEVGFLAREDLPALIQVLVERGYRCVGPQVRDGAIVYDTLTDVAQLPQGIGVEQAPGRYRLTHHDSVRCFAWSNGPEALRPLLFAPRESLWEVKRDASGRLQFEACAPVAEPVAVIGARACDLAALELQDRHFVPDSGYSDPYYGARREALLVIGIDCTHPADTCFCASTGDGPALASKFDVGLHELDEGFLVWAGSPAGTPIVERLSLPPADKEQRRFAKEAVQAAAGAQHRGLPGRNLRDALFANLDHLRWEQVAARCLSCGNCTLVCPTCFCHRETEEPAVEGTSSVHSRQWDSCFTPGHSYMGGRVLREETRQRYRQWLTHKLGSWHDQYGRSGCVGCGRCITWCPVGIDITEEAEAICGAGDES